MRTLVALLEVDDPAWPMLAEAAISGGAVVLPVDRADGEAALSACR